MSATAPTEDGLAVPISGTAAAKAVREELAQRVAAVQVERPGFAPKLVIVQVGGREDSSVYIRMKAKAGAEVGVEVVHEHLPSASSKADILDLIAGLNADTSVHGIIVQMPLDLDNKEALGGAELEEEIMDAVDPRKDVDGFHTYNTGLLAKKRTNKKLNLVSCTPRGCIHLLEVRAQGVRCVCGRVHRKGCTMERRKGTGEVGKPQPVDGVCVCVCTFTVRVPRLLTIPTHLFSRLSSFHPSTPPASYPSPPSHCKTPISIANRKWPRWTSPAKTVGLQTLHPTTRASDDWSHIRRKPAWSQMRVLTRVQPLSCSPVATFRLTPAPYPIYSLRSQSSSSGAATS